MPQNILNSNILIDEALRQLTNNMNFTDNLTKFSDKFAKSYDDAGMPGVTINIPKPSYNTVVTGLPLQVTPISEQSVPFTCATVKGIHLAVTDVDLTMNIKDFSTRYVEPNIPRLAAAIEVDCINNLSKGVYNMVGTANTVPGTLSTTGSNVSAHQTIGVARVLMSQNLAPMDDKWNIILSSRMEQGALLEFKGLFQDSSEISKQYLKGKMGVTAGFNFYRNEMAYVHSMGTYTGTPVVNGANQTGANLNTRGWTAGDVISQGTVFDISSGTKVQMVNAETYVPYAKIDVSGQLTANTANGYTVGQQFVCTATTTADANGNMSIPISPSIITSTAYQTVSASPSDGAALTMSTGRATAANYGEGLAFHPLFGGFATVPLQIPRGVDMAGRRELKGISMRLVRAWDANSAQMFTRLEVLYGSQILWPQIAARITM